MFIYIQMVEVKRTDEWKWRVGDDLIDRWLYFRKQVSYRTKLEIWDFESNDTDSYYDDVWDMVYDDDEPYWYDNLYYRWEKEENELFDKWLHIVRESITWKRKWSEAPAYLHSLRVSDKLFINWYSKDVWMAWLLHDIIEDWWYTKEQLLELWYSKRTVELVDLCSHDGAIEDSFERWQKMIERLKEADDKEAWAIKVCDITDNLSECDLMKEEKLERFLYKKAPVFKELVEKYFKETQLEKSFNYAYERQLKKWNDNHS